eukprot:2196199-Alexandrium_andersonii.AAC.1
MSASLVGSEMCIRDSPIATNRNIEHRGSNAHSRTHRLLETAAPERLGASEYSSTQRGAPKLPSRKQEPERCLRYDKQWQSHCSRTCAFSNATRSRLENPFQNYRRHLTNAFEDNEGRNQSRKLPWSPLLSRLMAVLSQNSSHLRLASALLRPNLRISRKMYSSSS